jgi:hypothetical protein
MGDASRELFSSALFSSAATADWNRFSVMINPNDSARWPSSCRHPWARLPLAREQKLVMFSRNGAPETNPNDIVQGKGSMVVCSW